MPTTGVSKRDAEPQWWPLARPALLEARRRRQPRDALQRPSPPGGECALARRDLHAMYHAARSVIDALTIAA